VALFCFDCEFTTAFLGPSRIGYPLAALILSGGYFFPLPVKSDFSLSLQARNKLKLEVLTPLF
jgi:hypothetical protein